MCGIAGAWLTAGRDPAEPVRRMCERMIRRGPDAQGSWQDREAGVVFGHRRLAVIDLDKRSNQPFISRDGRLAMTYNGEIYNYQALRTELVSAGAELRTSSDTEVILELFARQGAAAFARLRGMFALAIWEKDARRLVLARDPYGIKPLYVARTDSGVLFASQVKALLASGRVSAAIDPAGLAGFHLWGSVPEPFTLYQSIQPIAPGSVLTIDERGGSETRSFADVRTAWDGPAADSKDFESAVRHALSSSVRAHLVADVPVAVLLSGGVDSGALAALASEQGQSTEGLTLRFPEFAGAGRDEAPRAAQIAACYGLRHTIHDITRSEFFADLPAILDAMDQPSIDGVNTWFASKGIAERGYKVALSGVGGDELFCGYNTFRSAPRLQGWARGLTSAAPVEPLVTAGLGALARLTRRPKLAGLARYGRTTEGAYLLWRGVRMPDDLAGVMPAETAQEGLRRLAEAEETSISARSRIGAVAALESTRYLRNQLLRDSDWASMAHSIELRTPLVDWTLLSALSPYAEQFMGGRGKASMAAAPAQPLPAAIVQHSKTGFGLPMDHWLADASGGEAASAVPGPWARRWAITVAESFGIEPVTGLKATTRARRRVGP